MEMPTTKALCDVIPGDRVLRRYVSGYGANAKTTYRIAAVKKVTAKLITTGSMEEYQRDTGKPRVKSQRSSLVQATPEILEAYRQQMAEEEQRRQEEQRRVDVHEKEIDQQADVAAEWIKKAAVWLVGQDPATIKERIGKQRLVDVYETLLHCKITADAPQ